MRALAVLLFALILAGCYVSTAPLITPATADYPIADGAHFDAFVPAGDKWLPSHQGRSIRRMGGYYIYVDDGEDVLPVESRWRGWPHRHPPFLLKRIASNLYVAQLSDNADPAKVREYAYELIRFDGKTAIQYSGTCAARPEWTRRHLIDRIEETSTRRCVFSNLKNLATVLREAAQNAAPEAKYILTSGR